MITDAILDDKVLKFKVDYNDVRPKFKSIETETDELKLSAAENKLAFLHPTRINKVTSYILANVRHKTHLGFMDIVSELEQRFPDPCAIETELDKKAFVKLFGEYLRAENILKNYDEFIQLKALQQIDLTDEQALEAFKAQYYLSDEQIAQMQIIRLPTERAEQDYRSTYNDINDWLRNEKGNDQKSQSDLDWDDVVFEIDLLKSQEINLDYILALIFEHQKNTHSKDSLIDEVIRLVRSSLGHRAKESLLVDFIEQTDLSLFLDKESVIEAFFTFARQALQRAIDELIVSENLNHDEAKRYIASSLKREYASDNGTDLNAILPKLSPLNPQYKTKKQHVFEKISALVETFKGVGSES